MGMYPMAIYSVYLVLDGESKPLLENFRKRYDSLSGKIEAHVTVVFPTECEKPDPFVEAVHQLNCSDRFGISLGDQIIYDGAVGYVCVLAGAPQITEIYTHLSKRLALKSPYQYRPHVTVLRDSRRSPEKIDFCHSDYEVSGIVVEEIMQDEVSRVVFHRRF